MNYKFIKISFLFAFAFFILLSSEVNASTIDTTNKYAWGDHIGWINFGCDNCSVAVTDSVITGYAWSANYGWINLAPSEGPITNDGTGDLSGYGWGENIGWINFDGVTIDSSGNFTGTATTTSNGSIAFTGDNFALSTDWSATSEEVAEESSGGGGSYIATSKPIFESDFLIEILEGNQVEDEDITLKFTGIDNVSQVAISESISFSGASWQTYLSQKSYTLSSKSGSKMLYIKFRSEDNGVSSVYKKSVVLVKDDSVVVETPKTEKPTESKKTCDATYKFTSYLTIGHSGAEVRKLQEVLEGLGHFTYAKGPTGYYGNVTKTAVVLFQKAKNLTPYPGFVGPGTRKALNESCGGEILKQVQDDKKEVEKPKVDTSGYKFTSYLYIGHSGEEVRKLQEVLEDLGHFTYSAGPTGYFGQVTKDAVIEFQRAHNLTPYPGWIGPGTRKALNEL